MITPMFEIIVWTGLIIFVVCLIGIFSFYAKMYRSLKKDYSDQLIKNTRLQAELSEKRSQSSTTIGGISAKIPKGAHSKAAVVDNNQSM
jgi:hypothetical protein